MKFSLKKLSMPRQALFLSGGILVLSVVYFMIVPLLALYLSTELQASPGQIGIVLAILAISNQGSQVFVGALSDRFGPKAVLSLGIFIDCLGYLGFAAAPSFPFQVLCVLALGLGTATVSLLGKVMLAEEAKDNRAEAFALRAAAINIGAAAGPVIGSVFFGRFEAALVLTAAVFALFWVILIRPMPSRANKETGGSAILAQVRTLLTNRPLVVVTAISAGFWYLYTQLTFTFPLYANDFFELGGKVGLLFALEAAVAVTLQYPAIAWFNQRYDSWQILSIGSAVLSLAFLLLGIVSAYWVLPVFVVLFAFGSVLILPTLDLLATKVSDPAALGRTLGFLSIGWAIGGVLGSLFGGFFYEAAKAGDQFNVFWIANGAVGAVTMTAFLLHRRFYIRKPTVETLSRGGRPEHPSR